jgi:carboxymethylenebutenolidase
MTQDTPSPRGVRTRTVTLSTYDGGQAKAFVAEPESPGPHPAVAFGAEAMGPNKFGRRVATELAALGYVTITPDYYRGGGPSQPDNYNDFTEVMAAINALDFGQAAFDVLAGVDWLKAQPQVDPRRVSTWGYCTGGTLTMLAAGLDRELAASVWFFPSQPRFEDLSVKHPMHAVDLIWSIACPVLLIVGDQDSLYPAEMVADIRRRFEQWGVDHQIIVYPGAGHAFSADAPHMHNADASAGSWKAATEFLARASGRTRVLEIAG